jgi:hypothetical protein
MSTAGRVLDVARSQIGTVEGAGGRQKYGAAYGVDGVAWCAQFAWWVFGQAGVGALIPKTAYTPTMYDWYRRQGLVDRTPRVGSLVFYDFPDSLMRIQHVGIVEAVNADGTITTIEANTTSGTAGSQDRGGGVWRRRRSQASVVGYGHPRYAGAPAAPQAPAQALDGSHLPSLSYGMRGDPRVASLQRFLNAAPWNPELPLLPVTGNYLGQTQGVVRRAQAQVGVTGADADGSVVGARTNRAFWKFPPGWRG